MTEEDVIRLVHQVQGQQEVNEMRVALERNIEALRNLNLVEVDFDKRQADMQATVRKSAADLLRSEEAFNKAGAGSKNFGQALLTAGRGVQDFQAAGLPGILNNIEGLTMALGGPAGLAGVFTAVAVGIQTFMPQIKELYRTLTGEGIKSVDDLSDSVAGLEDQIKQLEEKPTKVALDLQMIDAAKAKLEDLKKVAANLKATETTGVEADFQSAVRKMMKETVGSKGMASTLSEIEKATPGVFFDKTESEKAIEKRREQLAVEEADQDEWKIRKSKAEIARLEGLVPKERKAQIDELISEFTEGNVLAVGQVKAMRGRMPGAFGKEFGEAIDILPASPGELARQKELDEEMDEFEKKMKRLGPARDRQRAEAARAAAAKKAAQQREDDHFARIKAREAKEKERKDREQTAAARTAGIAGMQAVQAAAPEVEATIGGIGMGPVATAKATQLALKQISTGNTTQMNAVMTAVQEMIGTANLMNWEQKAYAANFLKMARQSRQQRTGRQH